MGILTFFVIADIPLAVTFLIVAAICAGLGMTGAIAEAGNPVFPWLRFVFFTLCDVILLAPAFTVLLKLTLQLPRGDWYQSAVAQLFIIAVGGVVALIATIDLHGKKALVSVAMLVRIAIVYTAIGGITVFCAVAMLYAMLRSFFATPGMLSWTTIGWACLWWLALGLWAALCFSDSLPQERLYNFLRRPPRSSQ